MSEWAGVRDLLAELAPVLRRGVDLDPNTLARLRVNDATAAVLARLPFGVLVARTIAIPDTGAQIDSTVRAGELLAWLDGSRTDVPESRDADWRGSVPPTTGWRRLESVPDSAVRDVVRTGALALKDAAAREGVPGAQPRAEVADALLDSVVLTVSADDDPAATAQLTLRTLSALTRMGFVARGSQVHVDRSGRWLRVAAAYGTVYAETAGLTMSPMRTR